MGWNVAFYPAFAGLAISLLIGVSFAIYLKPRLELVIDSLSGLVIVYVSALAFIEDLKLTGFVLLAVAIGFLVRARGRVRGLMHG